MAPSRHDWKIVDWDVKPQHNQPKNGLFVVIGYVVVNLVNNLYTSFLNWLMQLNINKMIGDSQSSWGK